jgi:hypothetical protein
MSDLTNLATPDIANYDEAFGAPNIGIDALFQLLTAPGNFTTTDVRQFPLLVFHSCDQIATGWGYTAISTGFKL